MDGLFIYLGSPIGNLGSCESLQHKPTSSRTGSHARTSGGMGAAAAVSAIGLLNSRTGFHAHSDGNVGAASAVSAIGLLNSRTGSHARSDGGMVATSEIIYFNYGTSLNIAPYSAWYIL